MQEVRRSNSMVIEIQIKKITIKSNEMKLKQYETKRSKKKLNIFDLLNFKKLTSHAFKFDFLIFR
jgi:hypothetical protein